MRLELKECMVVVEKELSRHDHIKGDSWKEMRLIDLTRLIQSNLREALSNSDHVYSQKFSDSLVDVTALCMMLHNRISDYHK